jgi:hypothetical protein
MGGSGMWGGLIQSGVGMVGSIYGAIHAAKNKKQLADIEKNMPTYTRPEEVKQLLDMYKTQANSTQMPGEKQYQQNIEQAGAGAIRNVQNMTESPTASLGNVADIYRQQMGAFQNLLSLKDQYHQQNQDKMANALAENAKYADMEFEYNRNAPWQRNYQNILNEWASNRGLMQQGAATMATGAGNTSMSSWYNNKSDNFDNTNTGQMKSDYNAAVNNGQGVMDNTGNMSSVRGIS